MKKRFTESERLSIIQEYLTSDLSKYAIAKKYQIDRGSILYWIRKFGLEDKPHAPFMQDSKIPHPSATDSDLLTEIKRLQRENRQLKTQLAYEKLGHDAFKELVELAEQTYQVEILKNSEAK